MSIEIACMYVRMLVCSLHTPKERDPLHTCWLEAKDTMYGAVSIQIITQLKSHSVTFVSSQ